MKTNPRLNEGIGELIRHLDEVTKTQEALLVRINEKIDAVKRADLAAMRAATLAEQKLVDEIERHNEVRRPLMDRIGAAMGLGPAVGRTMTISQMIERLPADRAEALAGAGARLRGVMIRVAQANRVASEICRGVLGHLSEVFKSAMSSAGESAGYSNRGGAVASRESRIIEAVG